LRCSERRSGQLENFNQRVVRVDTRNEIHHIDREVATLVAPTVA